MSAGVTNKGPSWGVSFTKVSALARTMTFSRASNGGLAVSGAREHNLWDLVNTNNEWAYSSTVAFTKTVESRRLACNMSSTVHWWLYVSLATGMYSWEKKTAFDLGVDGWHLISVPNNRNQSKQQGLINDVLSKFERFILHVSRGNLVKSRKLI